MRVVLCQMKNGLPSFLALSMKPLLLSTSTSSNVSMSYLALQPSCQFWQSGHVWERRQRAFVDDPLLADLAPARHHGRVIHIGRISSGPSCVGQSCRSSPVGSRTSTGPTSRRGGIGNRRTRRSRARVGRILVQVAEMVLAELPGRVALRLQNCRDRHGLVRHADVGAGLADGGQAGADRQFAGDEIGATRGATRLGVVVGEQHAFARRACRGSASCRT